ncbi:MAG: carboxypeptidase-like regulatory domain-containing protein [Chloroflexota bacterium]
MNAQRQFLTGTFGIIIPLTLAMFLIFSDDLGPASAHGTLINYEIKTTVDLIANFDDGSPMENAEITVFSPEDPSTPWLQGIADEEGRFSFSPDPAVTGDWDVRVRQAGHGDLISIPVTSESISSGVAGGQSNLQRLIMAAAVIWGFVGTALYFSARSKK